MSITLTINGVSYPYPNSAADTNWAAMQVAAMQALAAACTPPTWVDLTPAGTWAGTMECYKDALGVVRLRVANAELGGAPTITTLPVGYRPPAVARFTGVIQADSALAIVEVDTSGAVYLSPFDGSSPANGTYFEITFSTVT